MVLFYKSQGVAMEHKEKKNEIVIYQPDETIRIEVRLENDTVWLTQTQLCNLFGVVKSNISYHLKNIFETNELDYSATVQKNRTVQQESGRFVSRNIEYYNLDVIISLGYRINTKLGIQFRQWATRILKEYLLQGQVLNNRVAILEDKVERRFAIHEIEILELKNRVDFFVQTQTPPLQGVFFEGQLWDACSLVEKLIARAKSSILLIDNWVSIETLDMLAKKNSEVAVSIVTSKHGNKLASSDIAKFNAQYPTLTIKESAAFHDRFLILDDKEIYLIGASLKDLGKKCFAFTKMDTSTIPDIKLHI
jgi:hypothetical protein